ncbi:MAG: adenylate cyclase [Myxococcota bacterium]|jgi:adenylate cyclase
MSPTADPLAELAAWQRFHLRITLIYAVVVVLVLTAAATVSYQLLVESRLHGLKQRLALGAQALSVAIDADDLAALGAGDARRRAELDHRFGRIGDAFADVDSIYILLHDPDPTRLRFAHDWSRTPTESAKVGEVYDASELPVLLQGFDRPSVESELYEDEWGLSLSAYAPILGADGARLAVVGLDVQEGEILAMRSRVLRLTLLAYLVVFGVIGLVTVVIGRMVRVPIAHVIAAADAMARGELGVRLGLDRSDEFGILASSFDRMAAGLAEREFLRDTFGRYVSPSVAAQLLDAAEVTLGGEQRQVTVLLSDLAGYSTYSEVLEPRQLVALLNRYLGTMQESIDAEGGTVLEFVGDAIVAVFNAPTEQPDHASRAVRAALAMRLAMERVNAACEADGLADLYRSVGIERLSHRIGVHTGVVVAGNIGSATRIKYTVIGDAVNVAARLEALNKELGSEILMSEATRAAADPAVVATAVDHGIVKVKGRTGTVRVWQV